MEKSGIAFRNLELELELLFSISGYQYPQKSKGFDANWLYLEISISNNYRAFKGIDPALTTNDLSKISEWFGSLSRNEIPTCVNLSFMEPYIEFRLFRSTNGIVRFAINLNGKLKPPFCMAGFVTGEADADREFLAVFERSFQELTAYAECFEVLSAKYPTRWTALKASKRYLH